MFTLSKPVGRQESVSQLVLSLLRACDVNCVRTIDSDLVGSLFQAHRNEKINESHGQYINLLCLHYLFVYLSQEVSEQWDSLLFFFDDCHLDERK